MFYSLHLDASGIGIGSHAYAEQPASYPPGEIACTQAQAQNPGTWQVVSGALVPLPPTLAQQAAALLAAGLTISLSGSLTLSATLFPTDAVTTAKLADMAAMAARGVLPLGAAAYPMKDSIGVWHQFNAAQYQAVAGAIAAYAAALILIADGNPLGATALPSASASLTV